MPPRVLCLVVLAIAAVACSSGSDDSETEAARRTGTSQPPVAPTGTDPSPPKLPDDFTWSGRYVVADLDVDVAFTWHGADGDFQMIAGGEGDPIHFTNLVVDGELYTLTYTWPEVPRAACSHVGPFTVDEFNEGLAKASYAGREIHDSGQMVDHFRSVGVLELPEGIAPEIEEITTLRLPLMAADVYVDADDHERFAKVLHFGVQNLYDPNLDEWIVIDKTEETPGTVELPEECKPTD